MTAPGSSGRLVTVPDKPDASAVDSTDGVDHDPVTPPDLEPARSTQPLPSLDAPEAPRAPDYVRSRWPLVAARATITLLFGALGLVVPEVTLVGLLGVFGVFGVVGGVLLLVDAVRVGGAQRPLLAVQGVLGAAAGLVALVWSDPSLAVVVGVVGAWAVLSGLVELIAGLAGREGVPSAYVPVLAGAAWIVLGVLLFGRQDLELPAVAVLVGAFALGEGTMLLSSAMRLRQLPRH